MIDGDAGQVTEGIGCRMDAFGYLSGELHMNRVDRRHVARHALAGFAGARSCKHSGGKQELNSAGRHGGLGHRTASIASHRASRKRYGIVGSVTDGISMRTSRAAVPGDPTRRAMAAGS